VKTIDKFVLGNLGILFVGTLAQLWAPNSWQLAVVLVRLTLLAVLVVWTLRALRRP
jgi:hypothetical protein